VPPRLPDRYRLNIRLGSDGDIEEWLAQDESLDRPVLIRYLAPEASQERHRVFLDGVRAAAGLTEIHLQRVFAAAETTASAYSVSEWDGGVTIADRLHAGERLPLDEFLPNAAGLCLALAKFHDTGGIHGAIDTSAVHFSAAHPVKLGAFGRPPRWPDQAGDTAALAEVLRAAITGSGDPAIYPSHVIDGIPTAVDTALAEAIAGTTDAHALARSLSAIGYAPPVEAPTPRPWRTLAVFGMIALVICLIAAVGLAADFDPDSPFLYPVSAEPTTPTPTTPVTIPDQGDAAALSATVAVYDPLGDGTESDDSAQDVLDGRPETAWVTETYSRPIREIKDGVGLVFDVDGTPSALFVTGAADTTYLIGWAQNLPDTTDAWERIARGTLMSGENRIQLPVRAGGLWLLWLTALPERADGTFQSRIAIARFVAW
jgi:hypothetical protein